MPPIYERKLGKDENQETKEKNDRLQKGEKQEILQVLAICMCIVIFRAFYKMSVLVAAPHTANAVVQNCKL